MTSAGEIDIAYSMEIAVDPAWPTYTGGLGVLAGDILRSAADMGLAVASETVLERLDPVISVKLNGGDVKIRAWRHSIIGISGCQVPVYFLDADLSREPGMGTRPHE